MDPGADPDSEDLRDIRRYCAGESSAFDRLYARHASKLLLTVRSRLDGLPKNKAEDVVQETWMRVSAKVCKQTFTNFAGWLSAIARNLAIDEARKSKRLEEMTDADPVMDHRSTPDDWKAQQEQDDQLADAIASLEEKFRVVVELRLQGVAHEEIAQQLGIDVVTSSTRYKRAIDKLKKRFGVQV